MVGMHPSTPATQPAARIRDEGQTATVLGRHYPQQYRLMVTAPATHTGTNRPLTGPADPNGFPDRLTGRGQSTPRPGALRAPCRAGSPRTVHRCGPGA